MSNLEHASIPSSALESRISYIDWTSVFAGALIGTAIFVTFTTFGTGIGLSLTSPYLGQGASAKAAAIAIGIWTLWVVVSSFLATGYVAGRMRHCVPDTNIHESEIRDGAHGLVAWAIATLIAGLLTSAAVSGVIHESRSAMPEQTNHIQFVADSLFRGDKVQAPYDEALHHEATAILESAVTNGQVSPQDRAFLNRNVMTRTSVDANAAEAKVDAAINDVRDTTNAARKLTVISAFLAAAALAIGAAAAWWAATIGGQHRKDYRGISIFTRWH